MGKANKIISIFYVIYGDDTPIYVGYTNRTIKQRFKEHNADKDFSSYSKVGIKEVDRLEFDFTWNMVVVNANAKQVSDRESELIAEYGTSNSVYQKGLGAIQGGQTWVSVKSFIHNNKNNPKYRGMDSKELLAYLDSYHSQVNKIHNFVANYKDPRMNNLSNFITKYKDIRFQKLSNFIANYKDPRLIKLANLISKYKGHRLDKLSHFVSNYKDPRLIKLANLITHYQDPRLAKLSNFIIRYKNK